MATFYVPVISSAEDYDAFKRILNNQIPDTFDAWSWGVEKSVVQGGASGHDVQNQNRPGRIHPVL